MSRILLVGDCHLGLGYPNKHEKWFDVSKEYFENFLIPFVEKNLTEDDIVVQLGDLFDNRSFVPIDALNYAQEVIERISKVCPIHIIIGNHDLWTRSTSEINSVRPFRYMPNVFIYDKPEKIEYNGKSILMMPYVEKKAEQVKTLKKFTGCDYLFCHSDLNGAKMHLNSVAHKNKDKIDVDDFGGYKNVYSGHIHILQRNKNFTFVGSIHEMDRNDINNQKGIFLLDTKSGKEKFIPNNVSPKFKKFYLTSESDIDKLDSLNMKDYIDLYISNSLLINNRKLRRKLELKLESGKFESVEYLDDIAIRDEKLTDVEVSDTPEEMPDTEVFTVNSMEYKEVIRDYIINSTYDNNKIKNGILNIYDEIIRIYKEQYSE